jgi:serine/threonine-protein kinase
MGVAIVAGGWWIWRGGAPRVAVSPNVVAVLPFRVTGGDSSIAAFRDGMVELLSPLFTGAGVPRAVNPSLVLQKAGTGDLSADEARVLARRLGAGLVIQGSVVALADRHLVLSASLLDAASGATRATTTHSGPPDSLAGLIDELATELLVRASGESGRRLPPVLRTPLPAIQAYIAGQVAYREGRYAAADSQFNRALDIDSTFAHAALGRANSGLWTDTEGEDRAIRLAWVARHRLGSADRAVLVALAGPRYPSYSTDREVLEARERAVDSAGDRPEAWFLLGDMLHHNGWALGADAVEVRASAALRRGLELDTTLAEAQLHLIERATVTGDTVGLRRLVSGYLAVPRATSAHIRWRTAIALGDSSALRQVRAGLDQVPTISLQLIQTAAQYGGMGLEDAANAIAIWEQRAGSQRERLRVLMLHRVLALNRGRPSEALAALNAARPLSSDSHVLLRASVLDGLYWEGDSAAAERAARELERTADTPPARDAGDRLVQFRDRCVLEQWRVWRRQAMALDAGIDRLGTADPAVDVRWVPLYVGTCVALLRAARAVLERRPDAALLVGRFDSLSQQDVVLEEASLVAARLWQALGNPERALAAARRRMRYWTPTFLSSYLREEGRLAALTGDRAGAIRAYRHYLALRYNPEPALRPQVDAVRAELARLLGEP